MTAPDWQLLAAESALQDTIRVAALRNGWGESGIIPATKQGAGQCWKHPRRGTERTSFRAAEVYPNTGPIHPNKSSADRDSVRPLWSCAVRCAVEIEKRVCGLLQSSVPCGRRSSARGSLLGESPDDSRRVLGMGRREVDRGVWDIQSGEARRRLRLRSSGELPIASRGDSGRTATRSPLPESSVRESRSLGTGNCFGEYAAQHGSQYADQPNGSLRKGARAHAGESV